MVIAWEDWPSIHAISSLSLAQYCIWTKNSYYF